MTFSEFRATLRDLAGQPSGGDFDTMADRAINRYYRMILAFVDQDEQTREFTLTTAASTKDYGCPTYVKRINNIMYSTGRRRLDEITARGYNASFPGTTASGEPRKYHILGNFGVQTQPSSASALTVESSASGDSSNRYVRIKGFDSSGRLVDEQITLTGTTAVTTSASFAKIETVVKSNDAGSTITGYVTIKTSGGTTLAVIPYWDTMASHLWVRFYPIPDAAYALTVQGVMRKPDLVRDDDWPEFDPDYHHLIVSGAGSELLAQIGKSTMAGKMLNDYNRDLLVFKGTQGRKPNRAFYFNEVSTSPVISDRPLIPNVDYV